MAFLPSNRNNLQSTLYASGNFGKSAVWSFVEAFALFYLTDVLGFAAGVAGTLLLLSLIWDGITDPLMGAFGDRMAYRISTPGKYFFVGAPLTAVSFICLFQASAIPQSSQVLYILLTLLIFRTAYTIVDVPHNSMLSLLTQDSRERTKVASLRIFFSAIGKFVVTGASIFVLSESSTTVIQQRFSTVSVLLAIVYLSIMALCLVSIRRVSLIPAGKPTTPYRFREAVQSIVHNRQLTIVFILAAVVSLTTPVIGTVFLYYGKYAIGSESAGAVALTVMSACQAMSLLFWAALSNRLTYKKHAAQAAIACVFGSVLIALLVMSSDYTLYIVAACAGFSLGGVYMLNWSMLPDALDYDQTTTSRRYDLSVFGLYTLTNKVFIGLSHAYTGWILAIHGYKADTEAAYAGINSIISTLLIAPLLGSIVCLSLLRWHSVKQSAVPGQ